MQSNDQRGRHRPIFISWFPHLRRSDALAEALGGDSYMIHVLEEKRPLLAPIKYPLQAALTVWRLLRARPNAILVASPPFVAPLVAAGYAGLSGIPVVIDAHSGVFNDPKWSRFLSVSRRLSLRAAATITTGDHYAATVRGWGGTALVIGDVPVSLPRAEPADLGDGAHVVMPCSFSSDEPLEATLEALRATPEITLHITGRPRDLTSLLRIAPANVRFCGWLDDQAYSSLLRRADVVLALTTRDHTMQRAAYEAMSIGAPLVTSSWPLLRETFSAGALFVDDSPEQIASAVRAAVDDRERLSREMESLRARRSEIFERRLGELKRILGLQAQERIGGPLARTGR